MKKFARILFQKSLASILIGGFLLIALVLVYRASGEYLTRRQSIKSIVAKVLVSCLREKRNQPILDCGSFYTNMTREISEMNFQVWISNSKGAVLWTNTSETIPIVKQAFAESPMYFPLHGHQSSPFFSVPGGYLDDPVSGKRVIVGEPMPGNNTPYLRNQILGLLFLIFIFGIVLSTGIAVFTLSRRAKEARRILTTMQSGDLSIRFQAGKLDELSDLSASFNQMVDLLAKSLQDVRESERNRRVLIGELSHDLRTPLTSMTSFLQLLSGSEKLKSGLEKECVDSIAAEVNYLNQLVAGLFDLSQIESPQTRDDRTRINMTPILQGLANEFQITSQAGRVSVEVNIPLLDAWILGDALLARRMLFNLMENATRFAKTKVQISALATGGRLVIQIRDDGPGFPKELLPDFGRIPARRSLGMKVDEQTHLGLGSVISRKIVDLHQGTMEVANSSAGGARITISLQLLET